MGCGFSYDVLTKELKVLKFYRSLGLDLVELAS
jgi:hypothetical protein